MTYAPQFKDKTIGQLQSMREKTAKRTGILADPIMLNILDQEIASRGRALDVVDRTIQALGEPQSPATLDVTFLDQDVLCDCGKMTGQIPCSQCGSQTPCSSHLSLTQEQGGRWVGGERAWRRK